MFDLYKNLKNLVDSDVVEQVDNETVLCLDETRPAELLSYTATHVEWANKDIYYISDVHLVHKILRKFPKGATNKQIEGYIKKIVQNLMSDILKESFPEDKIDALISVLTGSENIFLFGGDISSSFEISKIFYNEFMNRCKDHSETKKYKVCAVLGNHEYWEFNNKKECCEAYKILFSSLNIRFLNNEICWINKHKFNKEDYDEESYKKIIPHIHNMLIVGGTGFAGKNNIFNACNGIYSNAISRQEEIDETKCWNDIYQYAVEYANKSNCVLLVLTHNPITDWTDNITENNNCIYFNGHTHKNNVYHDDENNIHIFADNQIGYFNSNIQFKKANINERFNPFASYKDGYHEVNSIDYIRFYDFMGDRIKGNGIVDYQLKTSNAKFYMIKHNGYYGFFLLNHKGAYICAGGRITKISNCNDIEYYNEKFLQMIEKYIQIMSPYRYAQEKIAKQVRSFGGDGKIHGCIIDIDFFSHIMLNPHDGTVTYYYSPMFGAVQSYDTILALLEAHNEDMATKYRKLLETKGDSNTAVTVNVESNKPSTLVKIDIKNSLYSVSGKINQLQRLFDKKILRDWNENILLSDEKLIE